MACTMTISISTILSITFPTRAIPGSTSRLPVATFTLPPARARGRTVDPRTASRKFFPARESGTCWTIGARRAATTGRIGSTRCANIFLSFFEADFVLELERRPSDQAELFQPVLALFDDLIVVDPDITPAGEHVDVGLGFPVGVSLAAIGITERKVHTREFFILKQNPDHFCYPA